MHFIRKALAGQSAACHAVATAATLTTAVLSVEAPGCGGRVNRASTDIQGKAGADSCSTFGGGPITLAPPVDVSVLALTDVGIASDGTAVYWVYGGEGSDTGTVMTVPVCGSIPTTLAAGQENAVGIAVDATDVYWATGSDIMKVSLAGGAPRASTTCIAGPPAESHPYPPAWAPLRGGPHPGRSIQGGGSTSGRSP
jgi:hypothetical protein